MYIHEMRSFLREGEMSIMADHHLPLAGNSDIQGAGDWDLRTYVDGNLVSIQNFSLAPSINERNRRLSGDYSSSSSQYDVIDEEPEEVPLRLQELLQTDAGQRSAQPTSSRPTSSRSRRRR